LQSSNLACTKKLIQESHQQVSLSASTAEVKSNWLLPLSMQIMDLENRSMICNIANPLCFIVLNTLNTVMLRIEKYIISD
jgi:hypothetical protein